MTICCQSLRQPHQGAGEALRRTPTVRTPWADIPTRPSRASSRRFPHLSTPDTGKHPEKPSIRQAPDRASILRISFDSSTPDTDMSITCDGRASLATASAPDTGMHPDTHRVMSISCNNSTPDASIAQHHEHQLRQLPHQTPT